MTLPLTTPVFTILSGLIEQRAGLHYRVQDLELVRDKISSRAERLSFDSLLDYYYFLRYDPQGTAELDALVEALVVHETYFFREADQLQVCLRRLLWNRFEECRKSLVSSPVRIWCAAAATGEEPLTIEMMLAEMNLLEHARIVASDISEKALARARGGTFGLRAGRALPVGIEGRFLRREGDKLCIDSSLVRAIDWRRINLLDEPAVRAMGTFDVVLARNVLIYFSDETVRQVVGSLGEALVPGGLLLVGASESLLRYGTSLQCEEHGGSFFYRRPS